RKRRKKSCGYGGPSQTPTHGGDEGPLFRHSPDTTCKRLFGLGSGWLWQSQWHGANGLGHLSPIGKATKIWKILAKLLLPAWEISLVKYSYIIFFSYTNLFLPPQNLLFRGGFFFFFLAWIADFRRLFLLPRSRRNAENVILKPAPVPAEAEVL